ncbi:MAG: intradiol ring-cleavage dioxygenase [Heteroscytonema crispum UTEX LB 1556]
MQQNKKKVAFSFSRREVLNIIRTTAAALVVGCIGRQPASGMKTKKLTQSSMQTATQMTPGCVVKPQQTEGPYFVDEKLNRSDIRSDPSDGSVSEGVELKLVFHVSRMSSSSCTPLSGAIIDVWHCDAKGVYSDVQDRSFDTRGKKFLRGYQVTDNNGTAQFITIYPGWYPGRTVHIHFKIRTDATSRQSYEFTSQLYFDDALTDEIHAQAIYATKGQRTLKNDQDRIFQDGGKELMLQFTKDDKSYTGTFDIGLQVS